MTQTTSLNVGIPGRFVRLDFISRLFPDAESEWDRDAIDTLIVADATPFSGRLRTMVFSHELAGLRSQMQTLYTSLGREGAKLEWMPLEATVRLDFQLQKTGSLDVEVRIRPEPAATTALEYSFAVDQTYLPIWIAELDVVLATYPVSSIFTVGRGRE